MRNLVAALFCAVIMSACVSTPQLNVNHAEATFALIKAAPDVHKIAVSPDTQLLAVHTSGDTYVLWNLATASVIGLLKDKTKSPLDYTRFISFTPDNKSLLIGGTYGLESLALPSLTERQILEKRNLEEMAWTPDGKSILTIGQDIPSILSSENKPTCTIVNDLSNNEITRKFEDCSEVVHHKDRWASVAVSPDGKYALTSNPFTLYLTDINSGKRIKSHSFLENNKEKKASEPYVFHASKGVKFSPDGRHVAVLCTRDFEIHIYELPSFKLVKSIDTVPNIFDFPRHMPGIFHYTSDGRTIVTGGFEDGAIKYWDVLNGAEIKTIKAHTSSAIINRLGALQISKNNKYLISGGDASTRIWDYTTGEEIATFISFEDGEWLVMTPNGYYNSSEKGDQHLKVTVGGQPYTISQLRESFYRPDLVKVALSGGSLKGFRKLAEIKAPPTVAIVDTPASIGTLETTVTVKVTDAGGGIGDVRLYLNGSAVVLDSSRGVTVTPTKDTGAVVKKYTVKLASGTNFIRAIAFNGDNSMQSSDATFQVVSTYKAPTRPSLHALVIGVNQYKNPKLQLNYAVADAKLFADTLQQTAAPLFKQVKIKQLLTSSETTQENILKELRSYRDLNPDDLFVFYVASHGTVDDGEYFLLSSNVGSTSTDRLKSDAISQHTLKEIVANIPATKKLIVIDTCSAGQLGDAIQAAAPTRGMSEDTAIKVLSRAVGSTILSASTSMQDALEGYQGHGLFTYVLADGLKGKADKGKTGFVKTTELADYVDNEVPVLAEKVFKRAQYPTISISGQAFPIGSVSGQDRP